MLNGYTAYSFVTSLVFYNFQAYNDSDPLYKDLVSGKENATDYSHLYNYKGRYRSDSDFFYLMSKYKGRQEDLVLDTFNSSKDAGVRNFLTPTESNIEPLYQYCAGE